MSYIPFKKFIFILHLLIFNCLNTVRADFPVISDKPEDDAFSVIVNGRPSCVHVSSYGSEYIYPLIKLISSQECRVKTFWRLDALNRISIDGYIEENKFVSYCLTEQTELKGDKWIYTKYSWDYLLLKPCVIDDPRQQWRYEHVGTGENNRLVNVGSGYQIGASSWTLATATNPSKLDKLKINTENAWLKLRAEPRGYQFSFALSWLWHGDIYSKFGDSYGVLRYDPKTGQISRTDKIDLQCLTSNHLNQPSKHKVYTSWKTCYDKYNTPEKPPLNQRWTIDSIHNLANQQNTDMPSSYPVVLIDVKQNILRIKQNGPNYGKPYTFTISYISEDKPSPDNQVTSVFYETGNYANWRVLTAGNNIQNLKSCPTDGVQEPTTPKAKKLPLLPSDFTLTNNWIERLYKISTTPYDDTLAFGNCGTCALQTMEAVMNFEKYQNVAPAAATPGLLFKDYLQAPVAQIKKTYPSLDLNVSTFSHIISILADSRGGLTSSKNYNFEIHRFFTAMLTQDIFSALLRGARLEPILTESIRAPKDRPIIVGYLVPAIFRSDARLSFRRMLTEPVGTVWALSMEFGYKSTSNPSGEVLTGGHMFYLIKHKDGIGYFPTAVDGLTLKAFTDAVNKRALTFIELWNIIDADMTAKYDEYQFYSLDFYKMDKYDAASNYFEKILTRQTCLNLQQKGARGFGTGTYDTTITRMNKCQYASFCNQYWYNPKEQCLNNN